MILVNFERKLNIADITAEKYVGDDPVINKLRQDYKLLRSKILPNQSTVVFKVDPRTTIIGKTGKKYTKHFYFKPTFSIDTPDGGKHTISYCLNYTPQPNGARPKLSPPQYVFHLSHNFRLPRDLDVMLVLMQSPLFRSGKIFIEDTLADAKTKANENAMGADLRFFLYSEHSPYSESREKIEKLARAWDVDFTDNMDLIIIKNRLFDKVLFNTKKGNTELDERAFINALKDEAGAGIRMRIELKEMLRRGLISYDEATEFWRDHTAIAGISNIVKVGFKERSDKWGVLVNWFAKYPDQINRLREQMRGVNTSQIEEEHGQTIDEMTAEKLDELLTIKKLTVNELSYAQMKKVAAYKQVSAVGKKEDLEKKLVNIYEIE